MADSNYGGKNGVSTVVTIVRSLCHIYGVFRTPIRNYFLGNPDMSPEQKATVLNWIDAVTGVCDIIEGTVYVKYEGDN